MEFFKWKDSFSIGNTGIDRQHRSFLESLNELYETLSTGNRDIIGKDLVRRLKGYVAMHFSFEEELMESAGYKELEQHRKQHRYFESQVLEFESAYIQGKSDILKSTLPFLRDWFLSHILEEDRKYVPYLKP